MQSSVQFQFNESTEEVSKAVTGKVSVSCTIYSRARCFLIRNILGQSSKSVASRAEDKLTTSIDNFTYYDS